MSPLEQPQTHALSREVLASLWDLQDLHRELVHEVTTLASLLDPSRRTNKKQNDPDDLEELETEPNTEITHGMEACYQPV